jgi:hypothetical protein
MVVIISHFRLFVSSPTISLGHKLVEQALGGNNIQRMKLFAQTSLFTIFKTNTPQMKQFVIALTLRERTNLDVLRRSAIKDYIGRGIEDKHKEKEESKEEYDGVKGND